MKRRLNTRDCLGYSLATEERIQEFSYKQIENEKLWKDKILMVYLHE